VLKTASIEHYQMLVHRIVSHTLERRPEMASMFEYYENLSPDVITQQSLFSEVCWIVYASGFRYAVVKKFWPALQRAFYDFDVPRIAEEGDLVSKAASRICEVSGFRNMVKAAWCVENAKRLYELDGNLCHLGGIRGFFQLMSMKSAEELVELAPQTISDLGLKGIGKTTIFHLMKNVGIDIFKPDIHVRRLLAKMELISHQNAPVSELCKGIVFLSTVSGYCISQLDTFLFAYGVTIGDHLPVCD
jgi:3-methyladenine DNA glycosylase Tag